MPKIKMAAMNRKYIYNTCIFGCARNSNEFQRLYQCFRGWATRLEVHFHLYLAVLNPHTLVVHPLKNLMFGSVRNQRWLPLTGSRYEITQISASIHDRNEIPTAIPMFSRSGDTTKLLRRLSDVRIWEKSMMAAINRK